VRRTLTPQLVDKPSTCLYLIDIGGGQNRLGGSCLAQCFDVAGGEPPDLDEPQRLVSLFDAIRQLDELELLLAYHDRSDGGLFATVCEMAFAGRTGLDIDLTMVSADSDAPLAALFAEELGAVMQINESDSAAVEKVLTECGLGGLFRRLGSVTSGERINFDFGAKVLEFSRTELHRTWSNVSYRMQALRDNPDTALEAYDVINDAEDPGLNPLLSFSLNENPATPYIQSGHRPKVAILREQGVNSHVEMAAAFDRAGFQPVDVHMSDVLSEHADLAAFAGLVACGGFSYGDVLGAGGGWAKSILFNPRCRDQFEQFFARPDSFTLGVCNGCQMLSGLSAIIPGADHWPGFVQNLSEQFEARLSLVEVMDSPSVFLQGMAGSRLLIASSHGEGRAEFAAPDHLADLTRAGRLAVRYVDNYGQPTVRYPSNPNGSPGGAAGFSSADGRVTIMMPHPERVFRATQHSWCPDGWGEDGPWMRMFQNARAWVG
jgi:phosphoribosylformylglycinamidine synthase